MGFEALERRAVFISCSRDMASAVPVVVAEIEEINRRLPAGAGFKPYHWMRADVSRDAAATWQEGIPRPSDPLCALVICLFGERLGEPLPPHFPLPDDIALPDWATWPPSSEAAIPITGTLFEFLDAVAGPRRPQVRCYFKVSERTFAPARLDARDRGYGFGHEYDRLREGRPRPPRAAEGDYDTQIDRLDAFATAAFRTGGRPWSAFGREGDTQEQCFEALRRLLRAELPKLLLGEEARGPAPKREPKGLLSYGPDDSDILFGRDRAVQRALDRLLALAEAPAGPPPLLLLTGRSGEGKSSVLRAGLVGRLRRGLYADSVGPFLAIDAPARRFLLAEPLAVLAEEAEQALGVPLFGQGLRFEDIRPEARLDRLADALARGLAERPRVADRGCRLFLGLDQLDEALALAEEDATAAARLRELLAALARLARDGLIWGALTALSGDLDRLRTIAPASDLAVEPLRPVGEEDLAEIVERSFATFRLPHEQAATVVADAAGWLDREAGPVLPLVSALMDELVRVAREAQRQRLAPGADGSEPPAPILIGDVLERLGERAWKQATDGVDFGQDERLARLLRQLVVTRIGGGEAVALRTCPADHAALREAPALLRALLDCRFLFRTGDGVRLAHAAILAGWSRARDWYATDRAHQIALAELEPRAERWGVDRAAGRAGRLATEPEELDRIEDLWFAWRQDADRLPLDYMRSCLTACVSTFESGGGVSRADGGNRFGMALTLRDDALERAWITALEAAQPQARQAMLAHRSAKAGNTPLGLAASYGHASTVRWLIAAGAEVDVVSNDGWTPLHGAAWAGEAGSTGALLEAGASADASLASGWTALHLAASNGHESVVRLLMDYRAEISARGDGQVTPLHLAAQYGHERVVRLLLEAQAEVDATTRRRATPLHLAAEYGHEGVARLLLEQRAEVNARADDQVTPLHMAAENGHEGVARLLLDQRAEVDAGTDAQWKPLHSAASNGHEGVARLLLEKRANVNAFDSTRWKPLHLAAQNGHEGVARLLLEAQAEVDARTDRQTTPLHLAAQHGYEC